MIVEKRHTFEKTVKKEVKMKMAVRGIQIREEDNPGKTWRIRGIDRISSPCNTDAKYTLTFKIRTKTWRTNILQVKSRPAAVDN